MHADPELLALLALGEAAGTEDDHRHVATCRACAAELAELRKVVDLARAAAALPLVDPDPRVWADVRRAVEARPAETRSWPRPDPRAHARLVPVLAPWAQAFGEAELATDDQGRRLLQVSLQAELPSSGVRHAWLVHRDDPAQRQSLGVLDGRHGLWTVEHAIDLDQYPFLEISQESIGSTEHSGQTIVRGELVTVA
jgi:hypothetical protein